MTHDYDDETLMAFADGRLDEPLFSEIADAMEADPAIAGRVERLAYGARLAKGLYGPLAEVPVPEGLRRRVEALVRSEGSNVVPFAPRRTPATQWQPMAVAAAIALVVAGPLGYFAGSAQTASSPIAIGQPLRGEVAALIGTLPSGEERRTGEAIVRPIATFDGGGGMLCREFEHDGETATVAVACRVGEEWRVDFAVTAPLGGDGYAPASSLESLDAYLSATEAGAPYDLKAEAAALSELAS